MDFITKYMYHNNSGNANAEIYNYCVKLNGIIATCTQGLQDRFD